MISSIIHVFHPSFPHPFFFPPLFHPPTDEALKAHTRKESLIKLPTDKSKEENVAQESTWDMAYLVSPQSEVKQNKNMIPYCTNDQLSKAPTVLLCWKNSHIGILLGLGSMQLGILLLTISRIYWAWVCESGLSCPSRTPLGSESLLRQGGPSLGLLQSYLLLFFGKDIVGDRAYSYLADKKECSALG